MKNSQPRRCPNVFVRNGRGNLSTSGAHRNLIVYGIPSATMKPMVAVSIPIRANQNVIVAMSNVSGNPLETPSKKAIAGFLRK